MKRYTSHEILEAINEISKLMEEGYSIQLATKKVAKSAGNILSRKIRRHPLYLHLLNHYLKSRGYHIRYYHKDGKLQAISAKKFDSQWG